MRMPPYLISLRVTDQGRTKFRLWLPLFLLWVLLLPLFGRVSLVNVRHALVWTVLAPLVITLSGPAIVQRALLR